jgi:UDP-N-acetylglucosamine 2-epimerase
VGGVAGRLKRIISSPSLLGSLTGSTPQDAFSPSPREGGSAPFEAVSLPGSRSSSPTNAGGVGVVTNSYIKREEQGVYHLSSLLSKSSDVEEIVSSSSESEIVTTTDSNNIEHEQNHHVKVIGLGFITNMAEYMAAADVLVSKAGPGTIAEAASLSLPVMLTSFLPGQEEGNVDYVVQNEFGTFVSDSDPQGISDVVANWLTDEQKLKHLSANAHKCGAPDAAAEIVNAIGESALRWKNINDSKHAKS